MIKPSKLTLSTILNSIKEGVFTIDEDFRVNYFNKAAEEITGIKRENAFGHFCFDIFRANICQSECALKKTLKTGRPLTNVEVNIINSNGETIPISVNTAILFDENGNRVGGVETFRDLSAIFKLRKQIKENYSFEDIISKNHKIKQIFEILPDVAESNATVLVQGPSGSGKGLMVRAIHQLSERRKEPFIKVNCGALPDTLLESELFGYEKGAFTDAKQNKPGRFTLAQKGTIFLDEIGDISSALQVKLLRVIQDKEFEPLGSTATIKADVRVVAATNKNLYELVQKNKFRSDLYYRLKVICIELPSLSDRKEDIPLLIEHFIKNFNIKTGKNILSVSSNVLKTLMNNEFPGNIRELENIIEHCFVLCKEDRIKLKHLPKELTNNKPIEAPIAEINGANPLKTAEAQVIIKLLKKHNGNRIKTAEDLGINRTTLWRKIKLFKIIL